MSAPLPAHKLAPITFMLEDYELASHPGVTLTEATLGIDIDFDGEWYIDHLFIGDEKGRPLAADEPMFEIITKAIYADEKLCEMIRDRCREEAQEAA